MKNIKRILNMFSGNSSNNWASEHMAIAVSSISNMLLWWKQQQRVDTTKDANKTNQKWKKKIRIKKKIYIKRTRNTILVHIEQLLAMCDVLFCVWVRLTTTYHNDKMFRLGPSQHHHHHHHHRVCEWDSFSYFTITVNIFSSRSRSRSFS